MKEKKTGVEDEPSDFSFDKEVPLWKLESSEKNWETKHEKGKAGVDN